MWMFVYVVNFLCAFEQWSWKCGTFWYTGFTTGWSLKFTVLVSCDSDMLLLNNLIVYEQIKINLVSWLILLYFRTVESLNLYKWGLYCYHIFYHWRLNHEPWYIFISFPWYHLGFKDSCLNFWKKDYKLHCIHGYLFWFVRSRSQHIT